MSKSIANVSISVIETHEGFKLKIKKKGDLEDFAMMWEMLNKDDSNFVKSVKALLLAISKKKQNIDLF